MKKYLNKKYVIAGILTVIALIYIVIVKTVDVAAVGPMDTKVGLSHINVAMHEATGVNMGWYDLTDWLGILSILVGCMFALAGLLQAINRKSIWKLDREIYALGGLYVVMAALYVLFEKVIVNYRPIIMPDAAEPEASFPSSHTMLVCVIMGSAIMMIDRFIDNAKAASICKVVFAVILTLTVAGRLISGVHWLSDIIGGILISAALLMWFGAVVNGSAGSDL